MTKPVIVKRSTKGSPLTYTELDTNFQNLQDATVGLQAGTAGTLVTSDLNSFITLVAGSGIVLVGNDSTKSINISTTESQNIFQNIAVAGQSTVSADTTSDTLTLAAGTNVTITTNDTTDTITINSTGGDLVNDLSPQLGGDLDVNTFKIVSTSNGDIELAPNGTGVVMLPGLTAVALDTANSRSKIFSQYNLQIGGYTTTVPSVLEIGNNQFQFGDGSNVFLTLETISSNISFTASANADITLDPSGTGRVVLASPTTVISAGSAGGLITTPGVGGITLRPNSNTGATLVVQGSSTAGNVSLTPSGTGSITLNGPVAISSTAGTPTVYENGYYEDMLQTPVSWLKITVGSSDYYLPLFQ